MKKLLCLTIFFLAFIPAALACSCIYPYPPPEESFEEADAVFSGKVTNIELTGMMPDQHYEATFEVESIWKGISESEVVVDTAKDSAMCGFVFEEGETYVVYAYAKEDGLFTHICSRTKNILTAAEDLEVFGKGKNVEAKEEGFSKSLAAGIVIAIVIVFFLLKKKK